MTTFADTEAGRVEGTSSAGIAVFKGVPFAAPPIGELRLQPAQPPVAWEGTRDCRDFGPISVQPVDPLIVMIPGTEGIFKDSGTVTGEDCLTLNIWTPDGDGQDSQKPVYVWIHGGAFLCGSGTGTWEDGERLARTAGVVVVSINYRLGALGGVALDDSGMNNQVTDQIAALRWVRDNIAGFGGDPGRVTIGGESAGGMSVAALMCAPAARGLFHQAIVQSGHAGLTLTADHCRRISAEYLAGLGVGHDDRAALAAVPVERILSVQDELTARVVVPFRPVIDGSVLPGPLPSIFEAGEQAPVPLLIGTNTDENNLFAEMAWGPGAGAAASLEDNLASMFADPDPATVKELAQLYLDAEDGDPGDAWRTATTDRDWRIPAREMADQHARSGQPVYAYEFTLRSTAREGRLRACHALDVPFPFGNLDGPGVSELTGDDPAGDDVRRAVETACLEAWGSFIRGEAPASSVLPEWSGYEPGERLTMQLGPSFELVAQPYQARLDALASHHPIEGFQPYSD